MIKARDRLIVALDCRDPMDMIFELGENVDYYKVGPWIQYSPIFENIIRYMLDNDKKIFMDSKLHDIPETMKNGIKAISHFAEFTTIHTGDYSYLQIQEAMEGRKKKNKILAVTSLTCSYPELITMQSRIDNAMNGDCDGVVVPFDYIKYVKQLRKAHGKKKKDFHIVVPGIRPMDSDTDDHRITATPYSAIIEGADYLVVGRPIVNSDDPVKMAQNILKDMQDAFDVKNS